MSSHSFSAAVSFVIASTLIAGGQFFKEQLASSRPGTLLAGVIGSLVFLFLLTMLSNLKMASAKAISAKSGMTEVIISLVLAVCSTAAIHRIAITICIIFSGVVLFILNAVSQLRYNPPVVVSTVEKKKNKAN